MYVPVSIWSGITECLTAPKVFTPSIFIISVPAPSIFAPALFNKFATSTIWGSLAAFSIVVTPSAITDANIRFIVAPTLTISKYIFVPIKRSAFNFKRPWLISTVAPSFSNPFKCKSIGLVPRLHPPGRGITASLYFPSKAPAK